MTHTTKANNRHKAHTTHCQTCGRALPKRAFRRECASCIKRAQGKDDFDWQMTRPSDAPFFPDEATWRCERCQRDVEQGDILFVGKWLCLGCAAMVLDVFA